MKPRELDFRAELRRLDRGPDTAEATGGVGVTRFLAQEREGSGEMLPKVKEVLRVASGLAVRGWPVDAELPRRFPPWFIAACAQERTVEEHDKWEAWWKTLAPQEQARAEAAREWSLLEWAYWMEPGNRHWFWWDAQPRSEPGKWDVWIVADGGPFPSGALRWLFRAAGAATFDESD